MLGKILIMASVVVLVLTISILIVQWLWNIIMPGLINASEITFWQTFGLMILIRILTYIKG